MRLLLFVILFLVSATTFAQAEKSLVVVEPSELPEDMTGMYLQQAGSNILTGIAIGVIGSIATGALYYYTSDPATMAFGAAIGVIGVGFSLSGISKLTKAGRSYELHHQK